MGVITSLELSPLPRKMNFHITQSLPSSCIEKIVGDYGLENFSTPNFQYHWTLESLRCEQPRNWTLETVARMLI